MIKQLSEKHLRALDRRRRVVANLDAVAYGPEFADKDIGDLVRWMFTFFDDEGTHVDSIWWSWGEGNQAPYPSKVLPLFDYPGFKRWADQGVNIMQVFLDETHKRGLEAFFSYRINGSDNDIGSPPKLAMKEAHPDWLIQAPWNSNGYWDFAVKGVRDYKLSILRDAAENYDFDGMEIDYARNPLVLRPGQQWQNRQKLTEFMRDVRSMTLEVERQRGRPYLLAARVPENLEGCHFDGLDVETWAREQLVDIFVMGCRSLDVDIAGFRRITAGTNIKLYPCLDDHHSSDGYQWPPIEVLRGVFANWWSQGADGIETFNFQIATAEASAQIGLRGSEPSWSTHRRAYQEMGSPETLRRKDKNFVVQRRGGGHGPTVVPNPEDWTTPRWMYFNTNMFAPLPARLANDGKADTLLTVYVGDDVASEAERIEGIIVRVLLSDPEASEFPEEQRLKQVNVATIGHADRHLPNYPPARGIESVIELRLNNALLGNPVEDRGWLVFTTQPDQFAVGSNLVGMRVTERPPDASREIAVEKLEVQVRYR